MNETPTKNTDGSRTITIENPDTNTVFILDLSKDEYDEFKTRVLE